VILDADRMATLIEDATRVFPEPMAAPPTA